MEWHPDAAKVAVLIADAPPHGLGEACDGFPNGCPAHHDPLAIARQLAERGVTMYTVGCEPALSAFFAAKDFLIRSVVAHRSKIRARRLCFSLHTTNRKSLISIKQTASRS